MDFHREGRVKSMISSSNSSLLKSPFNDENDDDDEDDEDEDDGDGDGDDDDEDDDEDDDDDVSALESDTSSGSFELLACSKTSRRRLCRMRLY